MSEARARAELHARTAAGGAVRVCEAHGQGCVGAEASHRLARSQGGQWCPTNLLALCRAAHATAHAHPDIARAAGVHVPSGRVPAEVPVWRWHAEWARAGWWLLVPAADGGPHLCVPVDAGEWGLPDVPEWAALTAAVAAHR